MASRVPCMTFWRLMSQLWQEKLCEPPCNVVGQHVDLRFTLFDIFLCVKPCGDI